VGRRIRRPAAFVLVESSNDCGPLSRVHFVDFPYDTLSIVRNHSWVFAEVEQTSGNRRFAQIPSMLGKKMKHLMVRIAAERPVDE
jgi:hypothetical protein